MTAKGYIVAANPKDAGYLLTANLLYMEKQKDGLTIESMLASDFGGGLTGTAIGAYNSSHASAAVGIAGDVIVNSIHRDFLRLMQPRR